MESLKYPVLFALLAGLVTYFLMNYYYKRKPKNDIDEAVNIRNAQQNNRNSIIASLIIGLLVGIAAYLYLAKPVVTSNFVPGSQYKFIKDTDSPSSYHIMSRGVNIPNKLPDVFIETF